jgi:hypothetical protein
VYAEHLREHLLLECKALLSDEPEAFAAPLDELWRLLVSLLAPRSLHPQDAGNALLALERAYADGVAELEQAGHDTRGMNVFDFLHRLSFLERKPTK